MQKWNLFCILHVVINDLSLHMPIYSWHKTLMVLLIFPHKRTECLFPIVGISGIVGVGEAFNLGRMSRTKCQLHILCSPKVTQYVLDCFPTILPWIRHAPNGNAYDICKVELGWLPSRTWDFLLPMHRESFSFALSQVSTESVEGDSLSDSRIDVGSEVGAGFESFKLNHFNAFRIYSIFER